MLFCSSDLSLKLWNIPRKVNRYTEPVFSKVLFLSSSSIMEWTEVHDLILAKEVRASEPWMFKPRTVDRGKVWNAIANTNKVKLNH